MKNLSTEVKAALVGGVFLLLAAIIAGIFQIVIKQQPSSTSTPTAIVQTPISTQTTNSATPTAILQTPIPTQTINFALPPQELYAQITSRPPSLSDPLSSQSNNQWDQYSNASVGCEFESGTYHAYTLQPNVAECLAQTTNFSNFAYQVRMTTISGDGGGLIFGSEGANSRKYRFYVSTGIYYDLYLTLDNIRLLSNSNGVVNAGLNRSNLLTVIVHLTFIYLYINGQFVAVANTIGGGPLFGQIGVFAIDSTKPTDVVFSAVKVWKL